MQLVVLPAAVPRVVARVEACACRDDDDGDGDGVEDELGDGDTLLFGEGVRDA